MSCKSGWRSPRGRHHLRSPLVDARWIEDGLDISCKSGRTGGRTDPPPPTPHHRSSVAATAGNDAEMDRGRTIKRVNVQRRGQPLQGFGDGSSSESDNDAFASITKSNKKKPRLASSFGGEEDQPPSNNNDNGDGVTAAADGSSGSKRHHDVGSARQAKMDALLQELQTAKPSDVAAPRGRDDYYGSVEEANYPGEHGFAPIKKGSYVEPGQEHLTSNLFVGNLDPMTTEEELTDVFRQFGDLYSVKIMWPRTAEERARNRNTGFVCFMRRADAEDAMDELCEKDPLGVGRRMMLRWGKNVKKTVQFGTGGVPTNLRKRPREGADGQKPEKTAAQRSVEESDRPEMSTSGNVAPSNSEPPLKEQKVSIPQGLTYDPAKDSAEAIIVTAPADTRRLKFITTVASFVAKDGSILEEKLRVTQSLNPEYQFLTLPGKGSVETTSLLLSGEDDDHFAEHIFYRWRVYAFCQGDGMNSWRTEPFVMFEPHGRYWIPPPLNTTAAEQEEAAEKRREDNRRAAQEERRKLVGKKDECITTGAGLKRAGQEKGAGAKLNEWEREVFHALLREKLCASQESICEAMAFCFDKSAAAREISELLREALLESDNGISVDTRIARLFLLSDILFNSQQPGVRNAFYYRQAVERMAPDVFESLGNHGGGRMTKNRLRKAVGSVLAAWTNWSVYNSNFIDELESKFEGRDVTLGKKIEEESRQESQEEKEADADDAPEANSGDIEQAVVSEKDHATVSTTPRGTWTSATTVDAPDADHDIDGASIDGESIEGEELNGSDIDGEALGDDEAIDPDFDGDPLSDVDGEPLQD
ncbi:hypothetical protein ACHAXT_002509 [Thalassiosira profunda]